MEPDFGMLSCIFSDPLVEITVVNGAYIAAFRSYTDREDEFGPIQEFKPIVHTDLSACAYTRYDEN